MNWSTNFTFLRESLSPIWTLSLPIVFSLSVLYLCLRQPPNPPPRQRKQKRGRKLPHIVEKRQEGMLPQWLRNLGRLRLMRIDGSSRRTAAVEPVEAQQPSQTSAFTGDSEAPACQKYDAFLVVDFEGTCELNSSFNYPNEIIEFPVCLMRWKRRKLEVVDVFHSHVKPTWKPKLSDFCTRLTGITQAQVDHAPEFPDVLSSLHKFLVKNELVDPETQEKLASFCWCSDGPFDIRDFIVKQCFISKIPMPFYLKGSVLDVRAMVIKWYRTKTKDAPRSMNISEQLRAVGLTGFEGREHCGLDDARNISRILANLADRDIPLAPNLKISPNRRWSWMGKPGEVREEMI